MKKELPKEIYLTKWGFLDDEQSLEEYQVTDKRTHKRSVKYVKVSRQ